MKKYLLLSFLLLSFVSSFSQEKKLLEEYKFRVNKYKALNILFGAAAQQINNSNGNNKNSATSGNLYSSFLTLHSKDNFYQISSSVLGTSLFYNKNKNASEQRKNNAYNINSDIDITNRWYKKKNFVELGGNINADISFQKRSFFLTANETEVNDKKIIGASIVLGVGKGRLENVVDMQNALWLNKILQEEGDFSKKLSEEEILGLAKTLTQANNFRILDGRKRVQFILKKVDEYLQSKLLVNKTNIDYFSRLNDIIFFANNFFRQAGTIKFIRVMPRLKNELAKNDRSGTFTSNGLNENKNSAIDLTTGIEAHKPINLKHQVDYGVAAIITLANYKYRNIDFVGNEFNLFSNSKGLGIDYNIGYNFYPNTRTNIGTKLEGKYNFIKGNDGSDFSNAIFFKTNVQYFVSYNVRLSFDAIVDYNQLSIFKNGTQFFNDNKIDFSFNTSLNIAL